MKINYVIAFVFFVLAVLCFLVVAIMYSKLSFIDYIYLFGGLLFSVLGIVFFRKGKKQ